MGDRDRYPSWARTMLGKLLLLANQPGEAFEVAKLALEDATEALPPEHPGIVEAAFLFARAEHTLGTAGSQIRLRQQFERFRNLP